MGVKTSLMAIAQMLPEPLYKGLRARYRALKSEIAMLRASYCDWRSFRRQSGLFAPHRRSVLEASIIKNYHRIEKGLALRSPRMGFGQEAIELLLDEVREYVRQFGPSGATAAAIHSLDEYLRFNAAEGSTLPRLAAVVDELRERHAAGGICCDAGGTKAVTREDIHRAGRIDLKGFFASRYSIRQFSGEPVDQSLIAEAVRLAQQSPSVCNRQSARVYVASGKALQARLLALQNGNRGFGDQADKILVVGSDLDCFLSVGERYQAWIDGGMFAMSLIYALHSLGLGTCCLNWSVEPPADKALHQAARLPDGISVIMLIAVGHIPDALRVAQSPRRPIDEVLRLLDADSNRGGKHIPPAPNP
jgi:nitroreductase